MGSPAKLVAIAEALGPLNRIRARARLNRARVLKKDQYFSNPLNIEVAIEPPIARRPVLMLSGTCGTTGPNRHMVRAHPAKKTLLLPWASPPCVISGSKKGEYFWIGSFSISTFLPSIVFF
jgi:hypothetical protein